MTQNPTSLTLRIAVAKGPDQEDRPSETPEYERLTYEDINKYYGAIRPEIQKTPCKRSWLCEELGCELYLKNETVHFTGSFKDRAARGVLLNLSPAERARGVVTASWGNYGLGLAHHGRRLGVPVKVFMPASSSTYKVERCRQLGGEVVLEERSFTGCLEQAVNDSQLTGAVFVPGCDAIPAIASSGTIGMEILEDVPDVDVVLVQVGSGSLLAGVALAVRRVRPEAQIIAVEPEACPTFYESMRKGQPVSTPDKPTLADSLAVDKLGPNSFYNARRYVSKTVLVSEEMLEDAMRKLVTWQKLVVEGAGVASLAAVLHCGIGELKNKKVVVILTGGNIDSCKLCRVLGCGGREEGASVETSAAEKKKKEEEAPAEEEAARREAVEDVTGSKGSTNDGSHTDDSATDSRSPGPAAPRLRQTVVRQQDDAAIAMSLFCKTLSFSPERPT